MNKIGIILLASFLASFTLEAQQSDCGEGRFVDHVFSEVKVSKDLQYGEAFTMSGKSQNLLLDFYEPAGDIAGERPLIIMAHGGAFISGNRSQMEEFCVDFAKRGYVCANIEYRLLDVLVLDSVGITEAALMATNDMRAAVRYFKEDASQSNTFGISFDHIYVAGVSAGAIMANHVGFLDTLDQIPDYIQTIINEHGGFEGNSSENIHLSSRVSGVLNYSGGIIRSHWIDEDDVPLYSAHDDLDPTVPCIYNTSDLLPFPVYLYGSCDMKDRADEMHLPNKLYLVSNSTEHVSYFASDSAKKTVLDESAVFLSSLICDAGTYSSERVMNNPYAVSVFPNPFRSHLNIRSTSAIREITVSGLSGQIYLKTSTFSGNSLNLGELSSGIYLIRITTSEGTEIIKAVKE